MDEDDLDDIIDPREKQRIYLVAADYQEERDIRMVLGCGNMRSTSPASGCVPTKSATITCFSEKD